MIPIETIFPLFGSASVTPAPVGTREARVIPEPLNSSGKTSDYSPSGVLGQHNSHHDHQDEAHPPPLGSASGTLTPTGTWEASTILGSITTWWYATPITLLNWNSDSIHHKRREPSNIK